MKLIVGLGNPGPAYARTRHNAGAMVVAALAAQWRVTWQRGLTGWRLSAALSAPVARQGQSVRLARPRTFMNASGVAVRRLLRHLRLTPEDCLIICDDVNLPFGRLRLRAAGSAGGHRGLASVLDTLGTEAVPRLRIGVGAAPLPKDLSDYVLGPFAPSQQARLREVIARAAEACETWVRQAGSTATTTR
ncbi:MAG: aminoacyl-tRNA hydrolase [Candidatus Omnitrophica bacterium]|nr:aminoacyl-tRNA hydrolase [Candidatus Omnitrophota bacterium]